MHGYSEGFLNTGLLFCLDYDETFTADPDLWLGFIQLAKSRGHSVICATMRHEHEGDEVREALSHVCERIIFTGRKAKHQYVQKQGYYPSIWIDDDPLSLFQDG